MNRTISTRLMALLATFAAIVALLFAKRHMATPLEMSSVLSVPNPPKSAFVSYSTLDRADAFLLKRLLDENGIKSWLDVFDIRTTGKIQDDLFGTIKDHDMFILLLSPNSVASGWVQQEIDVAMSIKTLRILPVILRPCNIPTQLENIIGFDAREGLETPSLRARLLQAVSGSSTVEGLLLLDSAERELQYEKSLQEHAESQFPQLMSELDEFLSQPIRKLEIKIKLDSLPKDPDTMLEVSLKLDGLGFHGVMSIFIARYREGKTWPNTLGFEEPAYGDYLLKPWPRLDVRYRWYSRTVKLVWVHQLPMRVNNIDTYTMWFDGSEFNPHEKLTIPQKFEIPSLSTLSTERSFFQLRSHNITGAEVIPISEDTDIWIEVLGQAGTQSIRLYRSHTTRHQHNILRAPYLSSPSMSPIIREALLHLYLRTSKINEYGSGDALGAVIERSLEIDKYESDDIQRLAAYSEYYNARSLELEGQLRAAQKCYERSGNLLWHLLQKGEVLLEDISILYLGAKRMMDRYLEQKRPDGAEYFLEHLLQAMEFAVEAKPEEPDFQRMLSKALYNRAKIDIALGRPHATALQSLCKSQALLLDLYKRVPNRERQTALIAILMESIGLYHEWKVSLPKLLEMWENALRPLVPGDIFEEAVAPPPPADELPVWLTDCTVDDWPTKEIRSAALRYALKVPEWWCCEYKVRGTHMEIEHLYHGRSDAEWLMVSFIDNIQPDWGDPRTRVGTFVALNQGMPFLHPLDPGHAPKMVPNTHRYLGTVPSLILKLNATEAHAYTGVTEVASSGTQNSTAFARYYLLIVVKQNFFWAITLSFETKLPVIALDKQLKLDDHLKAGAMLGKLQLGGPDEIF